MMATSSASPPFGSTMCSSGASTIIVFGEWVSVLLSSLIVSIPSSPVGGVVLDIASPISADTGASKWGAG